jgi:hypothetical protein
VTAGSEYKKRSHPFPQTDNTVSLVTWLRCINRERILLLLFLLLLLYILVSFMDDFD